MTWNKSCFTEGAVTLLKWCPLLFLYPWCFFPGNFQSRDYMECRILFLDRFTKKLVQMDFMWFFFCSGSWSCYNAVKLKVGLCVFPVCVSAKCRCLAIGYILRRWDHHLQCYTWSLCVVIGSLNGPSLNYLGKPPSYFSALYQFFLFYIPAYKFSSIVLNMVAAKTYLQNHSLEMSISHVNWSDWLILCYVVLWESLFSFVKLWNLFFLNVSSALLCCKKFF